MIIFSKTATILWLFMLMLFSFNIYYELRNIQRVDKWYAEFLDENGNPRPDTQEQLLKVGFRTEKVEKRDDGRTVYSIYPPFDQGLFTTFTSRFFFPIAIYKDTDGNVFSAGLHK